MLDEATSALDPKSQDALMQLLSDEMKSLTLISVGHRPELEQFHHIICTTGFLAPSWANRHV